MMKKLILSCVFLIVSGASALAGIPVDDAQQLTQKAQTSSVITDMVPVQQKHRDGQKGMDCATHTGQQGAMQNNTAMPDTSAGAAAVQKYDAQMPATPAADAKGGTLATQTLGKSAAAVVAGNIGAQSSITSNGPTYRSASILVGPSPTIMAGYDQNSSIGAQNGVSWNQVLATANLLVSAYNAINMTRVSGYSQAARGMYFTSWASGVGAAPNNAVCGAGFRGSGTSSDPCISTSSQWCQSLLDGGCWEHRYTDSAGNVVVYLERAQLR